MYSQIIHDTIIVRDSSNPNQMLTYTGMCLGTNENDPTRVQSWTVIDGVEGEMLFIDNQHQSTLQDEYIYHETIVHSLMSGLQNPTRVLILGGAEGCMAREVFRWPSVEHVVQVDWDKSLVDFFRTPDVAARWNNGAYNDPRIEVIHKDVLFWLKESTEQFDAIFVDLLDPESVDDHWFLEFILENCKEKLSETGGFIINVGSIIPNEPLNSACILAESMVKRFTAPSYTRFASKTFVPSFLGEWCFLMTVPPTWNHTFQTNTLPSGLKRFTKDEFHRITQWSIDYPDSLRLFQSQSSNEEYKKLTADAEEIIKHKTFEHNGC